MLDGTTNAKDARLVAAIEAADPFDGGCPADVCDDPAHGGRGGTMGDAAAALPVNKKDDFTEWFLDKLHQRERLGIQIGMNRAAQLCIDHGYVVAADKIIRATDKD